MTLKQCFEMFGGDYNGVMSRMMKEERVKRFILKFKNDQTFSMLTESLEKEDYNEAFRAAHTIKGLCQNLGLEKLYTSCCELTEELRGGRKPQDNLAYQQVKSDYEQIINAINLLDE